MLSKEELLNNTKYMVEANSFESLCLWERWNEKVEWESLSMGYGVSTEGGFISLLWKKINGQLVLFWEATSEKVDYRVVEDWLLKNTKVQLPHGRTNAMNFHIIVHNIQRGED